MTPAAIVQKLWNFCNVLRDDGMKRKRMADERTKKPFDQKSPVPNGYDWPSLLKKDGDDLFDLYRHLSPVGTVLIRN